MNRALGRRYVAPLLGALLFSASIGGVVIGGYAAVQEDFGLCGTPTILVTSSEVDRPTVGGRHTPSVPRLEYEELTRAERRAFDEAVDSPLNEGKVRGELAHETAFSRGAVVSHEGEAHYVTIGSMDECVALHPLVLPASVAGLLASLLLLVGPALVRRWLG